MIKVAAALYRQIVKKWAKSSVIQYGFKVCAISNTLCFGDGLKKAKAI